LVKRGGVLEEEPGDVVPRQKNNRDPQTARLIMFLSWLVFRPLIKPFILNRLPRPKYRSINTRKDGRKKNHTTINEKAALGPVLSPASRK
jgi:hypothetical protein